MDAGVGVPQLVEHAFHIYDGLAGGIGNNIDDDASVEVEEVLPVPVPDHPTQAANSEPGSHEEDEGDRPDDDLPGMEFGPPSEREMLESSATTPLFAGASLTTLGATLILLNCLRTHGATNVLVNELFGILSKSVLPSINSLPNTKYAASKILKQLEQATTPSTVVRGQALVSYFEEQSTKTWTHALTVG